MTEKQEQKKRDYNMIRLAGLGKDGAERVKVELPPKINVSTEKDDVLIFNSSERVQEILKAKFPEAKMSVEQSNQDVYQASFRL